MIIRSFIAEKTSIWYSAQNNDQKYSFPVMVYGFFVLQSTT